ncbi:MULTISPECIES: hypothetical protein [unclassified Pedobacter]|uniref:hypothetical protein n=1 Tax=unclassified Pedobacter TaxID=2628915 RepID=UPI00141EA97A|nr:MULTISPECIES: hypothetical protein [unclassified Pedobacter]NII83836.1 hypothetical protein [Pedobacter sp. SG908]NMN37686.1 hypothetical protein [Pedobacter sp. SG918]
MKNSISILLIICFSAFYAQSQVNLKAFKINGATVSSNQKELVLTWPAGKGAFGKVILDLDNSKPLFKSLRLGKPGALKEVAAHLDPAFVLRIGKRTLNSNSGGWNVFFDRVPTRPYTTNVVKFAKGATSVSTRGSQTVVRINGVQCETFSGALEITFYNGSPLFNVAAVVATPKDSTAILYDAGLISKKETWANVVWSDVKGNLQREKAAQADPSKNLEVKYRTVIGENTGGSLAVFPAPHQYFYPLDEAFNLKFTWKGSNYLNLIPDFGIGIRQDPLGDKRYVPWFNAPPNTQQRLNFFCLLSGGKADAALEEVKRFTHNDTYVPLAGYKTMASHFHNEFISDVVLSGKTVPEKPEFVDVLKKAGLNIVKLAEFHGPGHPKGPDSVRLKELDALFKQTKRLSDPNFLLLPGEEANNFYGGHWLAFFPKPIYWIMSRKSDQPFETNDPKYGKVYRINDKAEMLKLLEQEHGLAWTAHARTKASTGYPDKYKEEDFFKSETFMGAAWKAIPGDLSLPTLSKRVLNLMDDMANWGLKKHIISEADIFTITEQNEMYAHLNVNYLQLDKVPNYADGWQPVLDVMRKGKFFVSTGEVLIPSFNVNGKGAGETLKVGNSGKAKINVQLNWTFPLSFVEIVSGDGAKVYRNRINLNATQAFGKKNFSWSVNLKGRHWVRVEAWDIATNGAFTQMVWLE